MNNIVFIRLEKLVCHEKVNNKRFKELMKQIKKDKKLKKPIVVDKDTMIILDGHHRHQVFLRLGIKKIPCFLVDYFDKNIKVGFRRPEIKNRLIKEIIIQKTKEGKILPYKTTRHILPFRPTVNYQLVIP